MDLREKKRIRDWIAETFEGKNPIYVPGVLCTNHGPFSWGADAAEMDCSCYEQRWHMEHLKKILGKHYYRTNISSESMEKMLIMEMTYNIEIEDLNRKGDQGYE